MNPQFSLRSLQKFCPFDGHPLNDEKFCVQCQKKLNIQIGLPRKPRNLFEKMPDGIEDNYVDELFLQGMPHKNSFPDLHYPVMIKNTVEIVHIVNSVFLQIGLFYVMLNSEKGSKIENVFFGLTVVISFFAYIVYRYFMMEPPTSTTLLYRIWQIMVSSAKIIFSKEFFDDSKTILFLTMILVMLTPVLGNLTATVADNTITLLYSGKYFQLTELLVMVFIHLIQYDFQMIIDKPEDRKSNESKALTEAPLKKKLAD